MTEQRKKHNPLEGELYESVKADLEAGMRRGKVCEKHGVSYIQLQKTFGFLHKKTRKAGVVEQEQVQSSA